MQLSASDNPEKSLSARARRQQRMMSAAVVVIGGSLLLFSGAGLWQRYKSTHNSQPLPAPASVATSDAAPDETAIASDSRYDVPAGQPRSISFPNGIQGFVQKVGLDRNGNVGVPSNVHMAGWFTGSDKPGNEGLSVIDGHVQGRYEPGIFKNLSKLKPGNVFTVEFGDKHTKKFEIISVTSYPADQVNQHLFKKLDAVQAQLNLITCGGKYDSASREYSERILVVSKKLQ
jgi:LPXTG-site transpeptidase (sortase) family protein